MLVPAVETGAGTPHLFDHRADPAVTAGEQALDDAWTSVVVAKTDRPPDLPITADGVAQQLQPVVGDLV